jgi:hypothetical protein
MGFSVRGHICIRRKAKDGEPGAAGKSIRTTVWEAGKQYYAGDTQVDGVYPLDIVSDKAMSIGVSGVNFYMCRTSHTSASNIPLSNTAYWTKLNNLKPVVTYLILAEAIKANYIDVEDLAASSAFIQNLIVNKLRVKDGNGHVLLYAGDTSYPLLCGSDQAAQALTKIGADGKIYAKGGEIGGFTLSDDSIGQIVDHVSDYAEGIIKKDYAKFSHVNESSGSGRVEIDCDAEPTPGHILMKLYTYNAGFDYDGDLPYIALNVQAGSTGDKNPAAIRIQAGRVWGLRPKVRVISSTTTTLDSDDYHVIFNLQTASSCTVNLPSSPQAGQTYMIWCCNGASFSLNGNGKNMRQCYSGGSSSVSSMTVNSYQTIMAVFDGTMWNVTKIS